MPLISGNVVTLLDYARQIDPTGKLVGYNQMVNNIVLPNEALDDILWMPCNAGMRHLTTRITKLPTGYTRRLNQGVPDSTYKTEQVDVGCSMVEDFFKIDYKLAEQNGNSATWRANAEKAFDAGMGQTVTRKMFYATMAANPADFDGFAVLYNRLNDPWFQVLDAGGRVNGQNASIYLIGWGSETVHGLFPQGSQAGMKKRDLGLLRVPDEFGNHYLAYVTHFSWDIGLVVRNPKYVIRIANIDIPALLTAGDGAADVSANILKLMTVATTKVPSLADARFAWYANNNIMAMLLVKLQEKTQNTLTISDYEGRQNVVKFANIPVRKCDLLLDTEDVVA